MPELRFASFRARLQVTWGAVKSQDERPLSAAPLTAPQVTHRRSMQLGNKLIKDGRQVGLDFS